MIILPNDLTTQEIRVLQEYRRLNAETMSVDQIKAIKHPAGGGEAPAVSLVGKGWLSGNADGYTLTEKAKVFLLADPVPMFEESAGAGAAGDAEVDPEGV
jgi:hypothetical protein